MSEVSSLVLCDAELLCFLRLVSGLFSDPYFFLGPFCATIYRVLSYFTSLSVLAPQSSCRFDACYLDAEVSGV